MCVVCWLQWLRVLIALALVLAAIAGVVALLAGATGGAAGYEAPTEYASAPGPSAYEKVYSVLNSLKEAARKYQNTLEEDDPRFLLGTGTGNSVTFDNESFYTATMFFILGTVLAFFAYGYLYPSGRYYYSYDDTTGYSNYDQDHTYTVHRSLENAAKKFDEGVGEEGAKREGRLFFTAGLDNNTQVNINIQAILVTIAYLIGIGLLIALIVVVATGGGSASWGSWFDRIMQSQGYVYQPNYNQDYYYQDSSYAAYRAFEEVPQKYGIYEEEEQTHE
ncbi:hypothetical protein C7M84_006028 [Penaeus vannamei]|uniref:Uncharacterized protein n=1 Tax=Penaeus vannamei TaxID=6689 RepID=A0A423TG34_PENVA|nr:hypothetical protein C7M84_006028 [Penaeus vannamei]